MPADHSSIISFTTTLSPNPPGRVGFGKVLLLVPKASNSLNSATTLEVASYAEAQAAQTAGYISSTTLARLQVAFSQTPRPSAVKVGNVDLAAGTPETYAAAFSRILAVTNDFYMVVIDSRDATEIDALADAVEADNTKQFLFVDEDASWLDSGVATGFSGITSYLRTSGIWHDVSTAYPDLALACGRLAFDPDEKSVDWKQQLVGVANITDALTAAERGFILSNKLNVGLPFGSQTNFLFPGQSISGRAIYEVLSADWFRARVQEDVADLYARAAAFGDKIIVGPEGQAQVLAILEARLAHGVRAKHFLQGQTRATALSVTQADLDAKRLRFTAEAQVAQSANALVFNFYLQNEPLAAA